MFQTIDNHLFYLTYTFMRIGKVEQPHLVEISCTSQEEKEEKEEMTTFLPSFTLQHVPTGRISAT